MARPRLLRLQELRINPATVIGHYKLLQKIGEGGMGEVWMAEQEEHIRRKVALKVVKLGMDTKQVIARFEAERQALALMDHPNIAKVLDAGATETGRPYFVMELVRGVRITNYCDEHKLTTRARLDLFMQVCHAIRARNLWTTSKDEWEYPPAVGRGTLVFRTHRGVDLHCEAPTRSAAHQMKSRAHPGVSTSWRSAQSGWSRSSVFWPQTADCVQVSFSIC
jgi:serine/threonine protein kinase